MLTIRPATLDDSLDILAWRNDLGARSMFRDSSIIAEEDHVRWFAGAILRDDRVFFIGEVDGEKVGMMRFDRINQDTWEVSHNMAPAARGRGFGQLMVKEALAQFICPLIVAEIREDNRACWHIYEKAGFKMTSTDGVSRHYSLNRA